MIFRFKEGLGKKEGAMFLRGGDTLVNTMQVQGLTLEEVVISFDLIRQKNFNYGQMYVALSGVTSLNGLYLIGELNMSYIRADLRAIYEYHRI